MLDDQHHEHHNDDQGQQVQAFERRSYEDDARNDHGSHQPLQGLSPKGAPHGKVDAAQKPGQLRREAATLLDHETVWQCQNSNGTSCPSFVINMTG